MIPKKLYRSKINRTVAGVCGGLGEYFAIDPIFFRLLVLITGGGLGAYILLWILVPENPNQKTAK